MTETRIAKILGRWLLAAAIVLLAGYSHTNSRTVLAAEKPYHLNPS
jgi:hypothetical protein